MENELMTGDFSHETYHESLINGNVQASCTLFLLNVFLWIFYGYTIDIPIYHHVYT